MFFLFLFNYVTSLSAVCDENHCHLPLLNCSAEMKLVKKRIAGQCCPDWNCGICVLFLSIIIWISNVGPLSPLTDPSLSVLLSSECDCESATIPSCKVVRHVCLGGSLVTYITFQLFSGEQQYLKDVINSLASSIKLNMVTHISSTAIFH